MDRVRASDYYNIAQIESPAISPTGDAVAFIRREPRDSRSYEATVHIAPIGGGEVRQFTTNAGVDAEPRWSPDGDRLAFVSTRGGNGRQLWIMPTDGGEAHRVTNVPGDVTDISWSPDGEQLAFTQPTTAAERKTGVDCDVANADRKPYDRERPDPRVIDRPLYRTDEQYFDGARRHMYVVDQSGNVTRVTNGDQDFVSPTWGDATTLYWAATHNSDSTTFDIKQYNLASKECKTVTQTTGWEPRLAATADGRLAVTRIPDERLSLRQTEIDIVDANTGAITTLTEDLDRTVNELTPEWDPKGEFVYFCTPDEGGVVLRRGRGRVGGGSPGTEVVLGGTRHVDGFSVGRDAVAITQSEWDHPGDVFLATPAGAEEVRLTRVNADYLRGRAVREPEELWIKSDGHDIQTWVLTPPDLDPDQTYPLAVEIHGGPHTMWSAAGTTWHEFQALAAAGYVVCWSNPRGSTGYGTAHATAVERNWGQVTTTDIQNVIDVVVDREYVDEEEIFVAGGSFGGFATAWLVSHTDRFTAAVAQRGVYDLVSFYGSTDLFELVEGDFDTTPWADPGFLWEQSPAAHVDDVNTPTLVLHAEDDYRVPISNAELFYRFLKKQDVDTRLVRYPREGHELSRRGEPAHIVDRLERIRRWFDGYSTHHGVPPALERGPGEGLSGGGPRD